jgi:predicted transcriptional regulator of viral defense system
MGRKSKFELAKDKISLTLNKYEKFVFKNQELEEIFDRNKSFWGLLDRMYFDDFIKIMVAEMPFKEHIFDFPQGTIKIYTWGYDNFYEILTSLKKGAYLSHYTALFQHSLTEQIPKYCYVSSNRKTLTPKTKLEDISQDAIDKAFSKEQRISNNFCVWGEFKIFLLEAAFPDNVGLMKVDIENEKNIWITDLERTLIDAVVRPAYVGGVGEILKAFELVANNISINKTCSYLKKLNYIYPYHQAIGFYMEKTGVYTEKQLNKIEERFNTIRKFYLVHGEKELSFSERWQIFYPKYLENGGI